MNKRGNVLLDFFVIMAVLFIVGITTFAAYKVIHTVNTSGVFADVPDAQQNINTTERVILNFDNLMMFIIIGLSLFVIISSAAVFNHPATFIISFILLCIAITVAATVSNTWYAFTNTASIADIAVAYPKISYLMTNLPFYILFMAITSMVVMYTAYTRQ